MAILESNTIKSTYQSLAYLFSDPAHNDAKTNKRVLACSGININMLHNSDGTLSTQQNGGYLAKQFHQNLKLAFNPNRKVQAQSIIISCSRDEFDTNDLDTQAKQLLQLANGFANKCFGDCQAVIAVQADGGHGQSGKLHAHILINSVKPRHGTSNRTMTVPTNRFSVRPLRNKLDDYLANNFELVTGRKWPGPINNQRSPESLKDLPNKAPWQRELKQTINEIKNQVTNIKDFLSRLKQQGITVTERGKTKQWTYHLTVDTTHGPRERKIRAFYQRIDKKNGNVLATRGLGTAYTKQGLEKYWESHLSKHQNIENLPNYKPIRKEVNNNEQKSNEQDEQLEKLKTLAADARAAAAQKQLRQHLNFEQLKRAKAEERKQYAAKEAANRNARAASNKARSKSISTQQRDREAAKRAIQAKQRRAQSNHQPNEGPDF
ncbi:MAG TPA: relaxase/mobilization nuclease domain-containing protein [Alloiococcus sp.]|nr:relaxase/mobilization nuclease domain-containing protein [Alloiococcus sp.]